MASFHDRVKLAAESLVIAAGFAQAVSATAIEDKAEMIKSDYAEYSKIHIAEKITSEIKKTHRPGVSGSL